MFRCWHALYEPLQIHLIHTAMVAGISCLLRQQGGWRPVFDRKMRCLAWDVINLLWDDAGIIAECDIYIYIPGLMGSPRRVGVILDRVFGQPYFLGDDSFSG